MSNFKRTGWWTPSLLACLIFARAVIAESQTPAPSKQPPTSGYSSFPLEGGYRPGTIVGLRRDGSVTDPIVTAEAFARYLHDSTALSLGARRPLPNTTFDRRQELIRGVTASAQGAIADADLRSSIQRVASVDLEVQRGESYGLRDGRIAQLEVLQKLGRPELELIVRAIANDEQPVMITEVAEYELASLRMHWSTVQDHSFRLRLLSFLRVGGTPQWSSDSSTLLVRYEAPVLTGFKAMPLDVSLINERLRFLGDSVRSRRELDSVETLRYLRRVLEEQSIRYEANHRLNVQTVGHTLELRFPRDSAEVPKGRLLYSVDLSAPLSTMHAATRDTASSGRVQVWQAPVRVTLYYYPPQGEPCTSQSLEVPGTLRITKDWISIAFLGDLYGSVERTWSNDERGPCQVQQTFKDIETRLHFSRDEIPVMSTSRP